MPRSFEEWNKEYEQYGGARRQTSAPSSNASPFGQILKPQFMVDPNSRSNFVPRSIAAVRHPYADYMTQWNAIKADAANMGLADSYGIPMQQYYALKGKPDWMIQADAADYQRTLAENPPAPFKRPSAYGLGNIDLNNRPVVADPDGGYATVRSMSFYDDDTRKETLIPTVVGGKIVGDQEAIDNYYRTGEYLGRFSTPTEATAYALRLHSDQDKMYTGGQGISSVRADVDADKREAISNRDYARYAQMMQQMPALEQWFGQFANDYTASYYKDQQQQYQPAAAQTPTSEQKLDEMYDRTPTKASQIAMQYEMERDGLSAPRESAVNAPTDQVLKNYVAEMRKKLDSLVASGDTRSQTYKTTKREVESGERQLLRFRPDYVQFDQENPDAMRKNAGAVNAPRPDVALKDPQYAMINYIDRVPNTKDGIDITQFVKSKFSQGTIEEQAAYPAIAMVQDFDLDKIYTHMSNSEKGIYNTIYHTEGKEKAEEYLRSLYKELAYRQNIELQQDFSAYAKAHPFNATMASIGITPFQGLGVLGGLEQLVGGEYYTPYSGVYGPTVAKETIRGTVTKDMNPLEQTLYGAGTSVGDMLSLLVAFGPYGGRVGLPAASYTSSQRESALKGGNGLQSNIVAAGDAAVEAITETIGWNRLRGLFEKGDLLKYGFKHVLSQIAQNGLFEGLEEMPGPTAHLFLDSVFMGANSEYNRRLKAMGGSGTMSDEVKDSLFKDVFNETLQGFGGGFIAGGVMSGGADISGSIANSQQVESVQKQLITENPWMSNETALQIAQQRTGMSPLDITPYEKAQQEYAENEAPGIQAVASVEEAAAQPYAPIRPTSEVQEDTARDMQTMPETFQKAPARPTSEVQEDTPRDMNPFMVTAKVDGQDVTISGMESVGQNATVKTEDGKTIPLEQIEIVDIGMNSLYNMARAFNDKDAANTFLGMFDGKIGAPAYIRAYTQYYTEGIRGTGTDALDKTATGQMLSPMARDAAYQTGQQVRIGLSEKAWGNFPVQAEKGYTGLVKAYTGKVSTDNQNKLVLIDRSAKKFGMQVIVVDSLRNANGMYGGGNTVYVAMDAIDGGVTKAASHEFLHYARQQDEGAYNQLKDIVLQAVGGSDVIAQRIQQEIDRHAAAGIKLTSDAALEEIVAQALPDVILNEQTAAQLANDNPTLLQKIVQWLREFVEKWRESFTGSPEAEALAKNGKAYQEALALFERTLESAASKTNTNATIEEQSAIKYSLVTDKNTLFFLENQATIKVYRAMQIIDGQLYPPMAAKVKSEDGKKALVMPSKIGAWEQAEERPDLIRDGKFELDKANGSSIAAAYNPYFHTSLSPLNDQFSSAYKRDNLVVVEGEVPSSELTSGYRAQYAKDAVGEMKWHSGPVSSKLQGAKSRRVILSRWFKPVRIVSDAEVATKISVLLNGENLEIPYNVVTPALAAELKKQGVNVSSADGIRYSLKSTDSEGNQLSSQQQRFFSSSKVVDESGHLAVMYHGTDSYKEFSTFKAGKKGWLGAGIYFTSDRNYAQRYASKNGYDGRVYEVYVDITNPITVTESNPVPAVLKAIYGKDSVYQNRSAKQGDDTFIITPADIKKAESKGYDGIIWRFNGDIEVSAFSSNQVKRIDNVAPTSSPDIRYSLKSTITSDADALQKENAKLRAAVSDLQAQFKLTEGHKLNRAKVEELSGQILRENQSRYNKQNLADNLNTVFEFIANTDGINWQEIMTATTDIAKAVLMESRQVNDEMYVANADLRKYLRTTPISLTSTQKAEVARMFDGANNFRKKLFGSVRITNDGTPLDVAWQELNEKYGEFFPADINEGDMPAHLMDVVNSLQPTVENPFGMNMDDAAADLALRIYDEYFDIPEVKTFADKKADELQRVKAKYRNRITEIREDYKERMQSQKQRMKDAYAQRDARKEETATRNGYISQIKRIAGELSTRLLANTDKSNIPEGMKKAVLSMLQSLDFVTEKTGERLSTKFALLQNEYQKLRDGGLNSETTLAGVYDEDVNDMLETLVEITSNKSVSDLETEELELVRNVVRTIQHMVATENKLFAQDRKQTVTDLGQKSIQWLYQQKSKKEWGKVTRIIQTMLTENTLNAETFFAQFEGTPIHDLYVALRDGLDTHILNNKQTEDYLKQAVKDYGYREWSKSAKQTLQTESGGTLELTVDEMLTLYATFKREGLTKTNHILGGGVTIKDAQNRIPSKLTKGDMDRLSGMLTDQQRAYADHMVNYLSTVGAEWGNEVSMKLNGFKKFNEKYYIPFRTNEDYTKKAPGQMGDIRLKAGSFTKSLTKRANTPIVIEPFTQLWAQHAEQMSMYNAFALPIEDMTRVWNYRDAEDRASSVKNAISSAFTRTGNDYIRNFLTDLNGGAITPVGQGLFDKLISITKRGNVTGNLSVAIQQMSAGVRAMAEVDAKYFIPGSVKGVRYRRSYAELLKWSPTAQLKQWGYFDTSMTRTIYERAKGGIMQWIQDKASWAAQQGDMLNWAQIWEAVKLETKAKTGLQGDALLEASARRFRDVVDRTQVVDSIFHRTEWARSKSGLVKLATAFKSEPMMMYNMLFRAKMAAANGNKGRAARYVGGVVSSMILNAALAAIVSGFRDRKNEKKDEKGNIIGVRTYEDKYVDAFMDKLVDAPMSIIPILSDAYSMWQGYSADRLDMQPLEKFVNAAKTLMSDKPWDQKLMKIAEFGSMVSGVPVYNIVRDGRGLYQGIYEMLNQNTLKGAAYDVTLPIAVRLQAAIANDPIKKPGRQSLNTGIYYDMLTMAKIQRMEGDVAAIKAELMRNGISESSIDSTLKERIRQAEPLVRDAAKLLLSGKVSEYSATVGKIEAAGYDREMAVEMAKAEATYIENAARKYMSMDDGESKDAYLKDMEKRGYSKAYLEQVYASLPEKEAGEDAAETLYRYSTLTNALESGNDHDIKMVLDQFVSEGKSMSTIRAHVTKEFKPIYYAAHLRGDTATMKRIETTLTKYLPYKNERKENDFKEWLSDSYYSDLYDLIDNGDATSAARLRKDMADKQIDNLGDIRDRLKAYYSARYKELIATDKAAAAKLKATLVSLSFSPEMIDNWARKRN